MHILNALLKGYSTLMKFSMAFMVYSDFIELSGSVQMNKYFALMTSKRCSRNLHEKSSEVSIKTRSTPDSLSFKGQATKHTIVKLSMARLLNFAPQIVAVRLFDNSLTKCIYFRGLKTTHLSDQTNLSLEVMQVAFE